VRAGLSAADVVVAPTLAMLETLRMEYGHDSGCVIPNGVDPDAFRPGRKGPYFAAAGRFWDRAKNLETLLGAAPRLPWPVRIAGARSRGSELPTGVQALGVLSRDALAGVLAGAGVFVHPARYEPFGLAPLEAAHAGCALILGDIPSLREVWGRAALFVPPDDVDALVSAAERLSKSPALRSELGRAAQSRAGRYTSAATAAEYLRVYWALAPERSHSVEEPAPGHHGPLHHVVVG
jgi:glycosyltransferase involved in cell wall biosynthesis